MNINKTIELTAEERALGVFSRTIPSAAYTYKVSFENEYGIWTHKIIQIGK
ncbi:MAG: hypothetical protein IKV00_07140 [Clostridia bacterium]|nr:hypothetical protein [Clostridia bacterium]